MAGSSSMFTPGDSQAVAADDRADASPAGKLPSLGLALSTALAGVVVLLDELVVWAGQPSGDPTAATVSQWYDAHSTRVLLGDGLWLAACGVLAAALWTAAARFPDVPKWTARAVGLPALTLLAASSVFTAQIALGVGVGGELTSWHLGVLAFRAGTVLLALTMVPVADGLRHSRHPWLAAPTVVVGLALAVPATSVLALVAAFVLVAVALLLRP